MIVRVPFVRFVASLVLPLLAACSGGERTPGASDSAIVAAAAACSGDNAGLTLPAGFCATMFADSIAHGRHVAVASNGDVYITLEGTQPSPEKQISGVAKQEQRAEVAALRDTNFAIGSDGARYVTDDLGGRVYRITHGSGAQ